MKREQLRKAARGISNHQSQDEALRLLLEAGTENLKRSAGYIPAKTKARVPKTVSRQSKRLIPAKSIEHLSKILADSDYHFALPEWAMTLSELGLAVPSEWMPALLNLGMDNETMRPYLMLLLDVRSYYLVAAFPGWEWIRKQQFLSAEELHSLYEHDAYELQRGFRNIVEGINVHTTMVTMARLASIPPPWSEDLADAFMSFLRHQIYRSHLINFLSPFLPKVLKFLPLEYAEGFMIIMDNNLEANYWWQNNREHVEIIFDFRRTIKQALHE